MLRTTFYPGSKLFLCAFRVWFYSCLVALFFALPSVVMAQKTSKSLRPLQQCWKFDGDETTGLPLAANAELIFAARSNGSVYALDRRNGELVWRADLGGQTSTAPFVGENLVFVASETTGVNQTAPSATVSLRALNSTTGVTQWQSELPQTIALNRLGIARQTLIAIAKNKLYLVSAVDGKIQRAENVSFDSEPAVLMNAAALYYKSPDDFLNLRDLTSETQPSRIKLPVKDTKEILAVADQTAFITDAIGKVTAVKLETGQKLWTLRLGATPQSLTVTAAGLLLVSRDNFVSLHSAVTGKRLWRRRLGGRPVGSAVLPDHTAAVLVAGQNSIVLLNLVNGKIAGQLLLESDNYATAPPLVKDDFLFVTTARGILAFAPLTANCKKTG